MIQLTYQELYRMNPLEARKILLETFEEMGGNVLRTAKTVHYSRNTVKKFVHRERLGLPIKDLSRKPKRSPRQMAKGTEVLVAKECKATNFGCLRLAYHLRKEHGLQTSSFTIRNILRRHRFAKSSKRRGEFRFISYYDRDKIYPLQHFQMDLKVIRDQKSPTGLPTSIFRSRSSLPTSGRLSTVTPRASSWPTPTRNPSPMGLPSCF